MAIPGQVWTHSVARQQRRQRRQERSAAANPESSLARRSRQRQQQVRPAAQPVKQQTGRRETAQRGRFARESWAELKKVEWPGRTQVVTGTVVVLIACAIVGAYLWVADFAFQNLVEKVLL